MKIAQVAPLYESIPPKHCGGRERIISHLTEDLVARGHDVTLFASGDSQTSATLVPMTEVALRSGEPCPDTLAPHLRMVEHLSRLAHEFDVIHVHLDFLHLPLMRARKYPCLTTVHGRVDLPELATFYRKFNEAPLVAVSSAQQRFLPFANWAGIVYSGVPRDTLTFNPVPDDYLAFVGRIRPEKGLDRAIAIAIASEQPLRIAACIDASCHDYFTHVIQPLLNHPLIEFVGDIDDVEKADLIGKARALLFPVNGPEPSGLVMAEALACGTPVIAWRTGAVPEVIRHGVTGYVVERLDEAQRAVKRIGRIDRAACRKEFERRFTSGRMADEYLRLYQRIAQSKIQPRVAL
jgi:glycosyltransferase involved in cell wall biosynthesis